MKRSYVVMKILFSAVLLFAALVCASAQTSTEQDRFREAEGRFASRNYGAALSLYDSFIREFPLSRYAPDAQFRKGICYYRLGRLNDSFAAFDLVRERFAATRFYGYLPFWQGLVLFDWGRFGEAAEYLDRYIKTGTEASLPEFLAEALQYRGRALAVLGQDDEARRELAKLLDYDNRNASIRSGLLLLASLYLKAGSPRQALDVLERLEADMIAGENPLTGYLYMAEALRGLGRLFEAEVMYREVIDGAAGNSDPSSVSAAFKRLFTLYENAGRDQDLENLLFQAEKLLSPYPEILSEFWLSAGIDYFRQNRFDLSASYFRRILSLEGTTPVPGSVYLYLAYNYEKQGQAQQAMRILEEALAKSGDGDGKEILLKLADLKLRSKLYGDAALLYESYLSRFGSAGAAGASYSLGFCYTALGDFTKARAVLESALKYGESSNLLPGIYRLLAIVYKQQR
ncbi:MAG: tetratricopeptide repeat protein, partial [Spirochaetales bacterium]